LVKVLMLRKVLFVVCAGVCAANVGQRCTLAQTPHGFWRGSSSADRVSDLKWIKLVIHYDSDFTFTTDTAGNVDGTATVRYAFRVDDAELRTFLANFNGLTNQQLAMTPIGGVPIGSVLGMATKYHDLQGLEGSYNGGTVVRQGRINGHLQGDQLHLQWASSPVPIPYTIYEVFTLRRAVFKKDTGVAYSPWIVDATVSQPAAGHWEAVVPEKQSTRKTGTTTWTIAWSAHQEPPSK
jgi:hypothetical protein